MSKQIEAMKRLGFSEEEIAQILADDKAIDKGQRMSFDLSPEEEKKAKKYACVDEHKKPAEKTERKRKENPTKAGIIADLETFLREKCRFPLENVQILNKERIISFEMDGNTYELTLSQKRKPKK